MNIPAQRIFLQSAAQELRENIFGQNRLCADKTDFTV